MRKVLKRSLSLLLSITIILGSMYVGLSEVDLGSLLVISAKATDVDELVSKLNDDGACNVYDYTNSSIATHDLGHVCEDDSCTVYGSDVSEDIESSHPYENNMNESWTIYKEGADHIAIIFSEETETEENYDWIYIYDCNDNCIGDYSGSELAGKRIAVPGDTIRIVLETDGSVTSYGFALDGVQVYYEECAHTETEYRNEEKGSCISEGYTGDVCCAECGLWISVGEYIPPTGHEWVNGECQNCGDTMWYYEVNDGEIGITGYAGSDRDVVIPDTINGLPVTYISYSVFYECDNIDSVTIPASITSIDVSVFGDKTSITNIYVDESNPVFASVDGVLFNKNKTELFRYPSGRTDISYTVPDGVAIINVAAFFACDHLETIILPESLTTIENEVFYNCESLESINIPRNVINMGDSVFNNCPNFAEITVDGRNTAFAAVDGVLFNKAKTELIKYPAGKTDSSYVIPNGVECIKGGALTKCDYLESITMANTVTTIESLAIHHCLNICYIEIPRSVISIEKNFINCSSLTEINVDEENTAYTSVDGVLFNKAKTELIKYPENKNDEAYTIPSGVTSIEAYAFYNAELTTVIIPSGVVSIGSRAFSECEYLTSIAIPEGVVTIGSSAFDGCRQLTSVAIPKSFKNKGNAIFMSCTNIEYVFYSGTQEEWEALEMGYDDDNDEINNGIIHYNATDHSYGNLSITEPTCTEPGKEYGVCILCDYIKDSIVTPALGHNWVDDVCTVCGSDIAATFQSTHPYEDNVSESWTIYKEGADHIAVTFSEETYIEDECDWIYIYDYNDACIGSYTGSELSGKRIVVIGDTIRIVLETDASITDYGFSLDAVDYYYEPCAHAETEIRNAYDGGCTEDGYTGDTYCIECGVLLESGEQITASGHDWLDEICQNCGNMVWVYEIFEDEATVIKYNGDEIDVVIPASFDGVNVTRIGNYAFADCREIKSITIPQGVKVIEDAVFEFCENLETVIIPDSVIHIGASSFLYCNSLETITIPASVTYIDEFAFDCSNLKYVCFSGSEAEWEEITIEEGNEQLENAIIHYNATDHSYGDLSTTEPTCDKEGSEYYPCSQCDYKKVLTTTPALGHKWVDDVCVVCGIDIAVTVQSAHPYENNVSESWTIYKEGADHIAVTFSEETYIEDGCDWIYIYDYNDACIGSYTGSELSGKRIAALGDTIRIVLETDDSVTDYGFSLDAVDYYYEPCTHAETEIRNAYDGECTIDGYTGDTCCIECGLLLETGEQIPATGHYWVDGVCKNCKRTLWRYSIIDDVEAIVEGYRGSESDIVIPDSFEGVPVTNIGECAFEGNTRITSVVIPDSVRNISYCAFNACESLEIVVLGKGLKTIEEFAFSGCEKLQKIRIYDGVTEIAESAFYDCKSLNSIVIPGSVNYIGYGACGYYYDTYTHEMQQDDDFVIYGYEGTAAEDYAGEYGFTFISLNSSAMHETEETTIDYENFVILTKVEKANEIADFLLVSDNAKITITPSYKYGDVEFFGTGTILSVYDGETYIGDFTLVVEGDVNSDSICDALDAMHVALVSNGHRELVGAYAMAADMDMDETIDASDYQTIVNKAVA